MRTIIVDYSVIAHLTITPLSNQLLPRVRVFTYRNLIAWASSTTTTTRLDQKLFYHAALEREEHIGTLRNT